MTSTVNPFLTQGQPFQPQTQQPNQFLPPQPTPQPAPQQHAPQQFQGVPAQAPQAQAPAPVQQAQYAPQTYQGAPQGGFQQSPADALGSLMEMSRGIGSTVLSQTRAELPLPRNVRYAEGVPPEKGMHGEPAISYVQLQEAHSFKGRDGRTHASAKGKLLWTNGDSPVNSEVGHMAYAGDYFQKELKQLVVAVCKLSKAQAADDGVMQQAINYVYGPQQGAKNVVIGMKTWVHESKNKRRGVLGHMFAAEPIIENGQITGYQPYNAG